MSFEVIKRKAANLGMKVAKHAPKICVGGGIVLTVAGAVFACKATLKADTVIEKYQSDIERVHRARELMSPEDGYSESDYAKDVATVYIQTGAGFAKLYWLSIALFGTGVALILAGYNILDKRYVATVAAYTSLQEGFDRYRSRVREKEGEEADRHYMFDHEQQEVASVNEAGETSTDIVEVINPYTTSQYARFFDSTSRYWVNNAEMNLLFLRGVQDSMNAKLKQNGHVFLNEVYEALGLCHTSAGAVTGWVLDEGGDNFIDFNLYNPNDAAGRMFVNGLEKVILLDFNVDGLIWDLI